MADNFADTTPQELGLPGPPARTIGPDSLPYGGGTMPLPHNKTFNSLYNFLGRAYRYYKDEALSFSLENTYRMTLDPVIWKALNLRFYPNAMLSWHLEPLDPEDPVQKTNAKNLEQVIRAFVLNVPRVRWWLLQGIWSGRSAVQFTHGWRYYKGKNWYVPVQSTHIDGDKLQFHWDGTVGVRVVSYFAHPQVTRSDVGPVYWLNPDERKQLVVHKYEPLDMPFWKPEFAGAINGSGLRGKLFWLWALKNRIWQMGVDYLEWFAAGITVYKFEYGNAEHQKAVAAWAAQADGKNAFMFPVFRDGTNAFMDPIQRIDPGNSANAGFLQNLITSYFDELITQSIVNQTLTSGTAPTGLGSNIADAHEDTFENVVKYDAVSVDEAMTQDLVAVLNEVNCPGNPCPRWVSEVDNPNVQQVMDSAERIVGLGGAVPAEPLMSAAGLPTPKDGDTILSNVQPQQPAAVDGLPTGVPVVTGSQ